MVVNEENFPRGGVAVTEGSEQKRKRRYIGGDGDSKKKQKRSSQKLQKEANDGVWTRKLTAKLCQPGLLVLACVKETKGRSLILELPGGLVASADLDEKMISGGLSDTAYPSGTLLACKILETSSSAISRKEEKLGFHNHVKVTLDPEQVNSGLLVASLVTSLNIVCAVKSVEDKGYQMNVGLPSVKAFLPFSECQSKELAVGQAVMAKIVKGTEADNRSSSPSRTVRLSTKSERLLETEPAESLQGIGKNQILPGMTFQSSVEKSNPMGVFVNIPDFGLRGFVANQLLPPKLIETGDTLSVIVTYIQPNSNMIGLSALPHLLDIANAKDRVTFGGIKVGDVIDNAKVTQLTSQEAVYFRLSKDLIGVANRKQIQVKSKGEEATVASVYSLGSKHTCRVVGYSLIDRILKVSTAKSILKQKIVVVRDAKPGQVLKAVKVESVKPSGIFVRVYDNLKGFIPMLHTADIPLRKPEKTLRKDKKLRCRVLYVDEEKERLVLTGKRSLVGSNLPPVSDYNQLQIDTVTDGVVVNLQDSGALVTLYGKAKGWIRKDQLKLAGILRPKTDLSLGQPVRVRILAVDTAEEKMELGLVSTYGNTVEELLGDEDKLALKEAQIDSVTSDGLKVTLIPSGVTALLPKSHLTDSCSEEVTSALLKLCFKPGDKITVAIFSTSGTSVTVTAKPTLLEAYKNKAILNRFEELQPGSLVYGVIEQRHPEFGYFIEIPGGLTGLANYSSTDGGSNSPLNAGQTVIASVVKVDDVKRRFSLTLRSKFCYPPSCSPVQIPMDLLKQALSDREKIRIMAGKSSDRKLQLLSGLKEADLLMDVSVDSVSSEGAICDLGIGDGLKGIVVNENMPKIGMIIVGAKVKAAVLAVDFDQMCAELSLSEDLMKKFEQGPKPKQLKAGDAMNGRVLLVKPDWVILWLEQAAKLAYLPSRIHPNEATSELRVGRKVRVVVQEKYGNDEVLTLSEKHETELRHTLSNNRSKIVMQSKGKIKMGGLYSCRVVSLNLKEVSIGIDIPGGATGLIHASELADFFESEGGTPLQDYFEANHEKIVTVKCIGHRKSQPGVKIAECTVRKSKLECTKMKRTLIGAQQDYGIGDELPVFVLKAEKEKVIVSINYLWSGFVNQLHLSKKLAIARKPKKYFKAGQVYMARVLTRHKKNHQLSLTFLALDDLNVTIGKTCLGRVLSNDLHEVRFELPNGHKAVASWADFSDDFGSAKTVKENLKKDQCVKVCPVRHLEHGSGWGVSIRKSLLKKKVEVEVKDPYLEKLEELSKRQILRGFVKEISKRWVDVVLGAESVKGKIPVPQKEEDLVDSGIAELYVGAVVTVQVRKINGTKIDLCLTAKDAKPRKRRRTNSTMSDLSSASDAPPVMNEKEVGIVPKFADVVASPSAEEPPTAKKIKLELDVQDRFDWQPTEFTLENMIGVGHPKEKAEAHSGLLAKHRDPRRKKIGSFERDKIAEEILYRKELSIMNQTPEEAKTTGDFDRMLFGSPNSSEIWLRYMAHLVKKGSIDQARMVAERALETIDQRESDERFNVWTGLLNLENHFGTPESQETAFERARRGVTDELKVYQQMLRIYQNSGKVTESDELCEEMLKKFRGSDADTWVTVGMQFMNTGRPDKCRELMQRALKSLPVQEHLPLLSRFAQMEYKSELGDKERGKTIFENILSSYPKKVDIWSVYIDMTVKYGSIDEARLLLERVTGTKLGSHKMRFFFKKWLDLEEKHGTDNSRKAVKEKAIEFVDEAQKRLIG